VAVGALSGQGTPNRASLLQIAAPHAHGAFRPWAEINPGDARRLKVEQGGWVHVSSELGRTTLPARISAGVRPGTVAIPWAPAAAGGGRYARFWRAGAEALVNDSLCADGYRGAYGLPVRVRRSRGVSA
jgi:hypothetical protein